MSFTLNGKHIYKDFGVMARVTSIPYIPRKRQTIVEVQGRDGQYVFEDGYDNISIEFSCTIIGETLFERRKKARQLTPWLASTGTLVLDSESDIEYRVVKVTNDLSATPTGTHYKDEFTIIFECEPYQQQTFYNDDAQWQDIPVFKYADIPWEGYTKKFSVYTGQTIEVVNAGTYQALPVIVLMGSATSVTIGGFTFTNLSGTVYIDCKNHVVYSIIDGKKVNKRTNFSGEYITLLPGKNKFNVSGTITTLTVEFDFKNAYL